MRLSYMIWDALFQRWRAFKLTAGMNARIKYILIKELAIPLQITIYIIYLKGKQWTLKQLPDLSTSI